MGYVHDTHTSQFIPPATIAKSAGTWTSSVASNVIQEARGASDAVFTLIIPVPIPSNASALKGAKLKSIDVFYKIATVAADDFATVELEKVSLPATGVAVAGAAIATACDTGHDTAAKRKALGDHTLTVTLTSPAWIGSSEAYYLQLVIDAAATTVFTLFGARINYDFRA